MGLTVVTWTPQSSPVANFEGTAAGVAMKVISPSSSSPWRFCEDMIVVAAFSNLLSSWVGVVSYSRTSI
jgi:hypothetical protein